MKYRFPRNPFPDIRRSTLAGFVLSALGLVSGGFGVARLAASFAGTPVSAVTLIATLLTGLVVGGAGFSLLVVGSDPFDDAAWEVREERTEEGEVAKSPLATTTADPVASVNESRRAAG